MTLMLIFGATALALAAIGIYGVIAYVAAQRSGELATRIALGASCRQVFWLMMGAGQRLAVAGLLVGLAIAYVGWPHRRQQRLRDARRPIRLVLSPPARSSRPSPASPR